MWVTIMSGYTTGSWRQVGTQPAAMVACGASISVLKPCEGILPLLGSAHSIQHARYCRTFLCIQIDLPILDGSAFQRCNVST